MRISLTRKYIAKLALVSLGMVVLTCGNITVCLLISWGFSEFLQSNQAALLDAVYLIYIMIVGVIVLASAATYANYKVCSLVMDRILAKWNIPA